jgi:hypothetical protein
MNTAAKTLETTAPEGPKLLTENTHENADNQNSL